MLPGSSSRGVITCRKSFLHILMPSLCLGFFFQEMEKSGTIYFPVFECLGILTADQMPKVTYCAQPEGGGLERSQGRTRCPSCSFTPRSRGPGLGVVERPEHLEFFPAIIKGLEQPSPISLNGESWKSGLLMFKGERVFCIFQVKWRTDFCRTVQCFNICC